MALKFINFCVTTKPIGRTRFFYTHLRNLSTDVKENTTATAANEEESDTYFGFQKVKESEKGKKVHKVFEEVANKYDIMNDVMSMGSHRIWKDIFVERLGPSPGCRVLDMAGGTGDIAFRIIKYIQNEQKSEDNVKSSSITISDINQHMLDVGKIKADRLGFKESLNNIDIDWVCANAENLSFEDNSFHAYTIAFGIRNVTHIDKVLSEAYRVLKPGGRFMCLEFSQLIDERLQWIYDQYSFQVIPPMGQILAGQWQPYQYLVESIKKFPKKEDFKSMIEKAGFNYVTYENLSFGIVSIHSGFKL